MGKIPERRQDKVRLVVCRQQALGSFGGTGGGGQGLSAAQRVEIVNIETWVWYGDISFDISLL